MPPTDRWGAALSLWHDTLEPGDDLTPRPPLPGDLDVDVAIVGAGFTGLWTAYYLCRTDPHLRVAVIERDTAGFGASGRNGGWCVGEQAAFPGVLEKAGGPGAAVRMIRAVEGCVDEIGLVCEAESIDCGFARAGTVNLAFNRAQLSRLEHHVRRHERLGLDGTYEIWDLPRTREVVRAEGAIGAVHQRHAAAVQPARLARGIARAAERHGASVFEGTAALAIEPRRVRTAHGTVRADIVVRATEGYTSTLEGQRRAVLPLGNSMIATEPLDDATWDEIGLAGRELFEDARLLLGYGQRTADGRIAWGGLGIRYEWDSAIPASPVHDDRAAERLRRRLVELFPVLRDVRISHHWGGVFGVARDLRPSVELDRATGEAWAGGYFGAGVAIANLAGRTLTDLIHGRRSDLTDLPWVGHRSRAWEPEPVRWLASRVAARGGAAVDAVDRRRG